MLRIIQSGKLLATVVAFCSFILVFGVVTAGAETIKMKFSHQNNVWIFTQRGSKGARKGLGVRVHFSLVDETLLVFVDKLNRIFNGDDVVFAIAVNEVDHCRQGRTLP